MAAILSKAVFCVVAALLLALESPLVSAGDGWTYGRATFYGMDEYSIHDGSCHYGQLDYNQGTGWDITALSDMNSDYAGSCGRCLEIQCQPSSFHDAYGNNIDRSNACYDTSKSVIVRVTDSCPCTHPNPNNRRWCCGDMPHMDMSEWAFQKLADTRNGVISIKYRTVDCPGSSSDYSGDGNGRKSGQTGFNPCSDKDYGCPGWKANGDCENKRDYMQDKCPFTCGFC